MVTTAARISLLTVIFLALRPLHLRWGATTSEVRGAMPGEKNSKTIEPTTISPFIALWRKDLRAMCSPGWYFEFR